MRVRGCSLAVGGLRGRRAAERPEAGVHSGGEVVVGREPAEQLGLDLPAVSERFERLEEALRLAARCGPATRARSTPPTTCWSTPSATPGRLPGPHPPVLIGGTGERHTLRLVATYGDACSLFDIPDGAQTVTRKLDVLRRHC